MLNIHIKKSFRKIKVRNNKLKPSAADALIDRRNLSKNMSDKSLLDAQIAQILVKEKIDKAELKNIL